MPNTRLRLSPLALRGHLTRLNELIDEAVTILDGIEDGEDRTVEDTTRITARQQQARPVAERLARDAAIAAKHLREGRSQLYTMRGHVRRLNEIADGH